MQQGRIEQLLLDAAKDSSTIEVERGTQAESLDLDEHSVKDQHAYPVTLKVLHLHRNKQTIETIHTKYLVGCDGAHSWTRGMLGLQLRGQKTEVLWEVMDIVPITNFRKLWSDPICIDRNANIWELTFV